MSPRLAQSITDACCSTSFLTCFARSVSLSSGNLSAKSYLTATDFNMSKKAISLKSSPSESPAVALNPPLDGLILRYYLPLFLYRRYRQHDITHFFPLEVFVCAAVRFETSVAVKFGSLKPHHQIVRVKQLLILYLKGEIRSGNRTILAISICNGNFIAIASGGSVVGEPTSAHYLIGNRVFSNLSRILKIFEITDTLRKFDRQITVASFHNFYIVAEPLISRFHSQGF